MHVEQGMWLSMKALTEKFGVTRKVIICMFRNNLLPKPKLLHIDNNVYHWNIDELELILFNNAKQSVNAKNVDWL